MPELDDEPDATESDGDAVLQERRDPEDADASDPNDLQATIASLRKDAEAQGAQVRELQEKAGRMEQELGLALQRYRQAILATSPEIPEELLTGETVADLEASLARAQSLVERVRNQMQAGLAPSRVPAGAPPRRAQDLASLSAREKIALGLDRHETHP